MRLLVLGGTHFLGRHVVAAGLARGHEVATFTRGRSGRAPEGVRDLHGDREVAGDLGAALGEWRPELVVDCSCQSRAAATQAAETLAGPAGADLRGYAFVSSINAYAGWPPGPVGSDDDPTWPEDTVLEGAEDYGPTKAWAERRLTAALDVPVLLARAGLICGPYDPLERLGWWLRRIGAGGRVVVPETLDQPMAIVDARDLADWLVRGAEQGWRGGVNATGPSDLITLGGLLETCVRVTGADVELVPLPEATLLEAGVEPWTHLPFWLPADVAATAWQVATPRARETGLVTRTVEQTVSDVWDWLRAEQPPARPGAGLPAELEARLLAG
ncbi:nucleoside-diphosphate-sugar epimerase [Friedmanniella endophytica]|uniref:Nucleoside-diphosphate-sugar epimerase n=1 Tax=Microlunatus kandeliicorticis TaxID=1759536 RepID=A0A7W3IQ10_9ACTN|nr:NAD-dependent epimerase/dehydratase family protein [Microlunatus kandeliicorticis]MBA8793118.1 nucleoside-diphosphate-sugar epimerase [Microlunatus kandeliicorticis]